MVCLSFRLSAPLQNHLSCSSSVRSLVSVISSSTTNDPYVSSVFFIRPKEVFTRSPSWNSRVISGHLKSLQVLYYDSLVLRRPKPGRSAHHSLPSTGLKKHHTLAFQLNRRKSIASLRMRPRVPNSTRFISWSSGVQRQALIARIYIRQNEKRKDQEVTARIERIFKLRDQAMRGVDTGARTMFIFMRACWR